MTLNSGQQLALDTVKSGQSIFLTGPPGTGKTYTLKEIITTLKLLGMNIAVTSTTGCSAIMIGGRTLHSYLKLGITMKTPDELHANLRKKYNKQYRELKELEVLVIDEISMLSSELFSCISKYMALIKQKELSFGGCQVIVVGDFCQLSPVEGEYAFMSPEWTEAKFETIHLSELVRQKGDLRFQSILGRARFSELTESDYALLRGTNARHAAATKLFPMNYQADRINKAELGKLLQKERGMSYIHLRSVGKPKEQMLTLCKGCHVMVTWNIDLEEMIINGTKGVVTELDKTTVTILLSDGRTYLVSNVQVKDEETNKVMYEFLPLDLSWATTIHKSQGATLEKLEVDLGCNVFADGQAYTALSRVRTLDDLNITKLSKKSFMTNKHVRDFYTKT